MFSFITSMLTSTNKNSFLHRLLGEPEVLTPTCACKGEWLDDSNVTHGTKMCAKVREH